LIPIAAHLTERAKEAVAAITDARSVPVNSQRVMAERLPVRPLR
jgi:hypothetical protein